MEDSLYVDRDVYRTPDGTYTCQPPTGMGMVLAVPAGATVRPHQRDLDYQKLRKALGPAGAEGRDEAGDGLEVSKGAAKLAAEHGIDLAAITDRGTDGKISVPDVRRYLKQRAADKT